MGGCSLRIWLQKDAYIVLDKGGGRGGRKHPIGAGFGNPKSEVSVGCRQAVCICRQKHSGIENLSSVLGCLCVSVDRARYIPEHVQDRIEQEFLTLTQRSMSVLEYEARFAELPKYAPHIVVDEQRKLKKLIMGLKPSLRTRLVPFRHRSMEEALSAACMQKAEMELYLEENIWIMFGLGIGILIRTGFGLWGRFSHWLGREERQAERRVPELCSGNLKRVGPRRIIKHRAACIQEAEMELYLEEKRASLKRLGSVFQWQDKKKKAQCFILGQWY
ncbi:hypothetical protein Taro_055812 [Colocasia esculenta]|uniref:Retrotransposon gag domain-containing protein n=1 Tax=Colocasia esculenta TaxID=4460 RepID=A0A843XVD7_COLES|nr:hypothetical protein [Colocasia esculenta]